MSFSAQRSTGPSRPEWGILCARPSGSVVLTRSASSLVRWGEAGLVTISGWEGFSGEHLLPMTPTMGHRFLVFGSVSIVLACSACGGSEGRGHAARSEAPAPNQEPSSRAEFVSKAKAICATAAGPPPPSLRASSPQAQLETAMDAWSEVARDLRKLDPPPADEARVARMLRHFENAIRAGRQLSKADDESTLALFAGLLDQGSKAAAIAASYGLEVCSPVPPMPSGDALAENDAFREAMLDLIEQVESGDVPTLTEP